MGNHSGRLCLTTGWKKINGHFSAKAVAFNINKEEECHQLVKKNDVVISMLPARFHTVVAEACLTYEKHLLTASYVSDEMKAFNQEAKKKNLLFLNECGLDPGIDHMSAKSD